MKKALLANQSSVVSSFPSCFQLFPIFLVLFLLLLSPLTVVADWDAYLGGSSRSLTTAEVMPEHWRLAWRKETGSEFTSSPVIRDGRLFIGARNGRFYAYDVTSGALLWSYRTAGAILATALVTDQRVFIPSHDGNLYAFAVDTGRPELIIPLNSSSSSSPTLANNSLYLTTSLIPRLFCIDATHGTILWSTVLPQPSQSSPLVVNQKVFIGCNDGTLRAFSTTTGTELFAFQTAGNPGFHSPVSLSPDGILFAPGIMDSKLYAIHGDNGNQLWDYSGGPTGTPFPARPGKRIGYSHTTRLVNLEKHLLAEDAKMINRFPSRSPRWFVAPIDPTLVYSSAAIAVDESAIYYVTGYPEAYLVSLDRITKTLKWSRSLGTYDETPGIYSAPVIIGGRIYIPNSTASIAVFSAASGTLIETIYLGSDSFSTPAFSNKSMFVSTMDGSLFCFTEAFDSQAPDVTPPLVTETFPVDGSVVVVDKPQITAHVVEEGSGIVASQCILRVDNTNLPLRWDPVQGQISAQPDSALSADLHTVFLRLVDGQGNESTANWSFTVSAEPDTTAPLLLPLSPAVGEVLSYTDRPEILIRITDNGGAGLNPSSFTLQIDENYKPFNFTAEKSLVSYFPESPLLKGVHQVRFMASDKAGNQSIPLVWNFTINVDPDSQPPQFSTPQPAANSVITTDLRPSIYLSITDLLSTINPASLVFRFDNQIVDFTDYSWDATNNILTFIPQEDLAAGERTCHVTAADSRGNVASFAWSFSIEPDLTPNQLRVSNLGANSALVCWLSPIAAGGRVFISTEEDLSSAICCEEKRGELIRDHVHTILLTSLQPDTTYYAKAESYHQLLQTSSVSFSFKTISNLTTTANILTGQVKKTDNLVADCLVYLTVERDGQFTLPAGTITDDSGNFTISTSQIMTRSGESFQLITGDKIRISARCGLSESAFSTMLFMEGSLDLGTLELSPEMTYLFPLAAGLTPIATFCENLQPATAFALLDCNPDIKELFTYDVVGQSYVSASRLFGTTAGTDFSLTAGTGFFVRTDDNSTLCIKGVPLVETADNSIVLQPGLNLVRFPGTGEMPDNPVSSMSSRQCLTQLSEVEVLCSLDEKRQFFLSTFRINGHVLGDDYDLRHDKAYFVGVTSLANITPPSPAFFPARDKGNLPAIATAPNRATTSKTVGQPSGFPPIPLAGFLTNKQGSPLADFPLTITLTSHGVDSLPLHLVTDKNGCYHTVLANFRVLTPLVNDSFSFSFKIESTHNSAEVLFPEKGLLWQLPVLTLDGGGE